jgi:gluconolactonase
MKNLLLIIFLVLVSSLPNFGQVSYTLEKIVDGCQFTEGPLWSTGNGLYFSDINGNTVYFWQPGAQKKAFITSSAGANGLAFDNQGRLVMCLQGGRKVVRRELAGAITVLASEYGGKKLLLPMMAAFFLLILHTD